MTERDDTAVPTRRDFLAMGGATAALASFGIEAWAQNAVELEPDAITNSDHATDVLVIGGGMAGLFAAVKAHDAGASVLIASKGRLGSSGLTPFGKGFFVFDPATETGSIDDFVQTVSRSALGTNNEVYTRQLAEHSLARANELRDWGYFDQTLANRPFMRPIEARDIPLLERVTITHLIKENGRIAGAAGFRLDARGNRHDPCEIRDPVHRGRGLQAQRLPPGRPDPRRDGDGIPDRGEGHGQGMERRPHHPHRPPRGHVRRLGRHV